MRPSEEAGENVYPRGTRMPPRDRRRSPDVSALLHALCPGHLGAPPLHLHRDPSLLRSFPSSWPAVLSHAFPPKHTLSSNFYSSFSSHIKYSFGKAVHPFSPTDEAQRPLPGFLSQGGHSPTAQFGTVCASAGFWDEGHARHVPMALLQFLSPPCLARDPPPADARPIFVE